MKKITYIKKGASQPTNINGRLNTDFSCMLCKYFRTPFYFLGPIIKMSKYVPLTTYFYVMPKDLDTF